jgi:hypothetical protein
MTQEKRTVLSVYACDHVVSARTHTGHRRPQPLPELAVENSAGVGLAIPDPTCLYPLHFVLPGDAVRWHKHTETGEDQPHTYGVTKRSLISSWGHARRVDVRVPTETDSVTDLPLPASWVRMQRRHEEGSPPQPRDRIVFAGYFQSLLFAAPMIESCPYCRRREA